MKELIDIVDENNRPTGMKKEKLQAHQEGCWHRTTQIWVLNQEGEILVGKRSFNQYQDSGKWASYFGGHLLAAETYIEGALRELQEELKIKAKSQRLRKVESRKNRGPNEFVQIFIFVIKKGETFTLSEEITEYRFVSKEELFAWAWKQPKDFSGDRAYIERQIQLLNQ